MQSGPPAVSRDNAEVKLQSVGERRHTLRPTWRFTNHNRIFPASYIGSNPLSDERLSV